MTFYLAHPFNNRCEVRDEIQPWLEDVFDMDLFNPFSIRPELYESKEYVSELLQDPEQRKLWPPSRIVEEDLRIIHKYCVGLVAYIGDISIGTQMEIFFNSYNLKRPTISVIRDDLSEDIKLHHPWLEYLTTTVMESNVTTDTLKTEMEKCGRRRYELSLRFEKRIMTKNTGE